MTISTRERKRNRLPRIRQEGGELPSFRLTGRDTEILKALALYRVLTTDQVEALLFSPAHFEQKLVNSKAKLVPTKCKYRLQKLYHYGYVERREQPVILGQGHKPYLYFLDQKGLNFLTHHDLFVDDEITFKDEARKADYLFLHHLLDINTVRICFTLAAQAHGWTIRRWIDEKALKQKQNVDIVQVKSTEGKISKASIVPDGFFTIETPQVDYNFLLEVDRSTETGEASTWSRRDFAFKIRAYGAYLTPQADEKSLFERRYSTDKVRILTITPGEKRASNLKVVTAHVGGKNRFWFTSMKQIKPSTVLTEAIWQIASREGAYSLIE